jgi:hypothetical protein
MIPEGTDTPRDIDAARPAECALTRQPCITQLKRALRRVRACSAFSANQGSISIWPHAARVVLRSSSHGRKTVAYLGSARRGLRPGEDVPGREEPDRREASAERNREACQSRAGSAGHEEFFQVRGRSPGLEFANI